MLVKGVNKIRLMAAAGLLTAALISAPANADHGHNYIAPLAAFITLNALFHHQHYRHHHRHHRHHGHHRPHHRKHSHSHGGYRGPRHKRHKHW